MITDEQLKDWEFTAAHSGFYLDGQEFLDLLDRLKAAEAVCKEVAEFNLVNGYELFPSLKAWEASKGEPSG